MMLRNAYHFVSMLAGPFLKAWLKIRVRQGKEDANRLSERFGVASVDRPAGPLVWVHAASVGESLSVLPLIENLRLRDWQVAITTGTATSAQLMETRLPTHVIHQFAPLDHRAWVERFYDHWHPDLVLWTESELWPNTLTTIAARKTPSILVNGRLSDHAFGGWQQRQTWAAQLLGSFSMILAQSEEDARRFKVLGGHEVHAVGNLKYAGDALPADPEKLDALHTAIGSRPTWLAASIHPGEVSAIANAHQITAQNHPELLTIIIPRHADRGAAMASSLSKAGLKVARRSKNQSVSADTSIYVADTMGETGLFYALCDIVFMGKSLAVGGGQNPVEPSQSGCAVLFGPDMTNFRDVASELLKFGAAMEIADGLGLGAAINRLLNDTHTRISMIDAAHQTIKHNKGALAETLDHLEPFLAQSAP